MAARAVAALVLFLLVATDGVAQDGEKYLVAIDVQRRDDISLLERLQLPVYHRFEEVLVTELTIRQATQLRRAGWSVAVLDKVSEAGRYTLLSGKKRRLNENDIGTGRVVFRHRDGWILKDFEAAQAETETKGLLAVPLRKTRWLFAADKIVPVSPVRADLDSLIVQTIAHVNADTVRAFIQALQDFGTRYYRSATRDAVADWIKTQFVRMGFTQVVIDSFLFANTWQKNVVATLPAATSSDNVIVIGGHHDSITRDDPMKFAPGADDNASGTTAVLEIARVLKASGHQPEVTFKFVTFAAEEAGLVGSGVYASMAAQTAMKIRLMINHDMISHTLRPVGSRAADINHYTGSSGFRDIAIQATSMYTSLISRIGTLNSPGSDSYRFWTEGFPAVYFEETDFSPYLHTRQDVIENYDMDYCAEVIRASCATLLVSSVKPSEVRSLILLDAGEGQSLHAQWYASVDFDHKEYKVYIGNATGAYDSVFSTTDTSVAITNLQVGVQYFVGVSSVDSDGHESFITERSGTPNLIPASPADFVALPEWHTVLLSWKGNSELDLLGYNIYRTTDSTAPAVRLNSSAVSDTSFRDNTAEVGVYYYYTVTAVDSSMLESAPADLQKSRVVSLDRGPLLVDETRDGDGGFLNPTDGEVDAFYDALLEGFAATRYDISQEGGIGLAELGAHSTVIWSADDFAELITPYSVREDVQRYLDYGGSFFYAGYRPAKAFSKLSTLSHDFLAGDFVYDYLKIRRMEYNLFGLVSGARAMVSGYSDIVVDSSKTRPEDFYHLHFLEAIFAAAGATEIYTAESTFDPTSPQGFLNGKPIGVEYLGTDYKIVVVGFPLYYMKGEQAKALVREVLLNKFSVATHVKDVTTEVSSRFALYQNYPNPFNPLTTIRYELPKKSHVILKIFNLLGQEVVTLVDEEKAAGTYEVRWDAGGFATGMYFYRLQARSPHGRHGRSGEFVETKKVVLIR